LLQYPASMRTWLALLVVIAVGCSGNVATVDGDDGGQHQGTDGATDAGGDGAACVTIDPSAFDLRCQGDSDCAVMPTGTICTGGCACGGDPINKTSYATFAAQLASVKTLACPCASPGTPMCVGGTCMICRYGPNGCRDGG
jgi:hypothetical protein